eukprot:CAMPEP_0117421580 /NCGR_PEP_ID=MMETSP0758-20121206/2627_1 /TAXON_ID=63605 /ORGANISM="Percolomonas cosmopolitus, Strain AE-1 (ATCC 50343)" /LENGTH=134 /DNA_ID=CAMNT_0005203757 /DNA_START=9 /DNA_END=409 /DNA_ORIENTATION=-
MNMFPTYFFATPYLTQALGFLYPAYKSFKALRSKEDEDDDIEMLGYWVSYAAFYMVETYLEMFIFWIPFYYEIKLFLLIWMVFPTSRKYAGGIVLYDMFVAPFFEKHEATMEDILTSLHYYDLFLTEDDLNPPV